MMPGLIQGMRMPLQMLRQDYVFDILSGMSYWVTGK
jgi:hypothetical protein